MAGRKVKEGIEYYSMDCGHITHKRVRLLMMDCGSDGYYIWQCILSSAYEQKGYYFDINDKDELALFADDYCKKDIETVNKVIAACISRGLFDKDIAGEYKVLTSERMQTNYFLATAERRRKRTIIPIYSEFLIMEIAENDGFTIVPRNNGNNPRNNSIYPRINEDNPRNNAQSKVKESNSKSKVEEEEANASFGKTKVLPVGEELEIKQLKEVWDKLEKTDMSVFHFIGNTAPSFIEPYVHMWNIWATNQGKPMVREITKLRRSQLKTRLKEKSFNFLEILRVAKKSQQILEGNWFSFDWIMCSPNNYIKVLEGNYVKDAHAQPPRAGQPAAPAATAMDDKLERAMMAKQVNTQNQPTTHE